MVCIPLCASILFVLPAGNHTSTCRPSPSCAFYFCTSEQKSLCIPSISHHHRNQCLCSILFVLPAGNHPNAISACVSHAPIRIHNSKCAPPVGHHRVALSFSAPVNKNHCAFHPSAITIAVSACAFQSVQSTHRQSTVAISACVSNIRVSNHSSLCVPPATIRTRAFYFYTSERKSFMQSTQSPT